LYKTFKPQNVETKSVNPSANLGTSLRKVAQALCLCVLSASAAYGQSVPASWAAPWQSLTPLKRDDIARIPRAEIPMSGTEVYTLGQLVDLAESNNPSTRAAWAEIKARAASVGIARSELYPTLLATAAGRTFLNPPLLYNTFVLQDIGLFETAVRLNYTLVDFGARRTEINAAKARLLAADLRFNNEHLNVIYQVSSAYYSLLKATGLRKAAEVSLRDAKAIEEAAQERMENGLATLPDVLEARAVAAKAAYDLQSSIGNERSSFGLLATTLTATPTQHFNVEDLDELRIPERLDQSVEDEIETAFRQRPDLLATVARVRANEQELKHEKKAYFPKVDFDGEKGWLRAWGQQEKFPGTYGQTSTYDARVSLTWTIFDGLKRESRISQARAERDAAQQEVHEQEDRIADHVWSDYAFAETSLEQRKAAASLLTAANESYQAATESYKDGVRNILDVLSAERALAQARADDVTARSQVLQAFTNLSFRTGDLLTKARQATHP
jgi:outer membrane protein